MALQSILVRGLALSSNWPSGRGFQSSKIYLFNFLSMLTLSNLFFNSDMHSWMFFFLLTFQNQPQLCINFKILPTVLVKSFIRTEKFPPEFDSNYNFRRLQENFEKKFCDRLNGTKKATIGLILIWMEPDANYFNATDPCYEGLDLVPVWLTDCCRCWRQWWLMAGRRSEGHGFEYDHSRLLSNSDNYEASDSEK